jgi:hypothetical protein
MRSILTAAAFVLFAAGLAMGQDEKKDEKKSDKYSSKEGKYSVNFPGKPMVTSNKAGGVDLHIAMVEQGGGGFGVIYSDLPADAAKSVKPKALLDGGQKGLIDNFKAKITTSKDFEFGKQKYPARELVAEKDPINLRIQIILVDNRLYQLLVVGPKDIITGKDADAFLKSFEITR